MAFFEHAPGYLFEATLTGQPPFKTDLPFTYQLLILDINDSFPSSIVQHEFIGNSGAILEDMGGKAHQAKFRCYFFGEGSPVPPEDTDVFSANYIRHVDFLRDMTASFQPLRTLVHPKYGTMKGYVNDVSSTHDDTLEYVAIDITFIQQGVTFTSTTVRDIYKANSDCIKLYNAQLAKAFSEYKGLHVDQILGVIINPLQTLAGQFHKVTSTVHQFLSETDQEISRLDNSLKEITAPADEITQAISFANDVPSRLLGVIDGAVTRTQKSLAALTNAPFQLVNNLSSAFINLITGVKGTYAGYFKTKLMTICAGRLVTYSMQALTQDELNRTKVIGLSNSKTFGNNGDRLVNNTDNTTPIMTVTEIEKVLALNAALVNVLLTGDGTTSGIYSDRDNQALKSLISDLIAYVDSIKVDRLNTQIIITNNIPLHVLAQQLGKSYQDAEIWLKLNPQIKNPAFLNGPVTVYVS